MSKRHLNSRQAFNLMLRVLNKYGLRVYRACPSNNWSYRRIPSI